jgi:hypothetical protein
MTNYVTIDLEEDGPIDDAKRAIVEAVINEGRLRMKEEILAKIERRIAENYQDKEMVQFLEELIRELELDL